MAKAKEKHSMKSTQIYSYSIRKAIAPRKRFAIQRTHIDSKGKKIHVDFKSDELKAINEEYLIKRSEISYNTAIINLEKYIKSLLAEQKEIIHVEDETKRAIKKFLKHKNDQKDKGQIRYTTVVKLEHEINLIEYLLKGVSLLTIDTFVFHEILTNTKLANSTKNKLIILSNSIRANSGITIKLLTLRNKTQLLGAVDFLSKIHQDLIYSKMTKIDLHITKFGIATGLREGELFALTSKSKKGNYVHVKTQLYRDETIGNPKNNRERLVPLSDAALISFEHLMNHIELFKKQRRTYSSRLRAITKKQLNYAYSIYDLRHTFAIECLAKGLPPITVCSWMGNSLVVFQKHYVGYMNSATKEDLQKLNAI